MNTGKEVCPMIAMLDALEQNEPLTLEDWDAPVDNADQVLKDLVAKQEAEKARKGQSAPAK